MLFILSRSRHVTSPCCPAGCCQGRWVWRGVADERGVGPDWVFQVSQAWNSSQTGPSVPESERSRPDAAVIGTMLSWFWHVMARPRGCKDSKDTALINSSHPSAAYMPQWIGPVLVQIMACRLSGAKPLPEAILTYSQLDQNSGKFESKYNFFFIIKMHLKMAAAKWGSFCPGGDEFNHARGFVLLRLHYLFAGLTRCTGHIRSDVSWHHPCRIWVNWY